MAVNPAKIRASNGKSTYFEPVKALHRIFAAVAVASAMRVPLVLAESEEAFEQPPVSYSATAPNDAITRLERRLASGEVRLVGDDRAILRELLRTLGVPESSQMLVFSKTSFQAGIIHPGNPRALYFSDDCYVGWVPGGLMEVTSIDPQLGPVFYSFDPRAKPEMRPRFTRDQDCLRCHGGTFVREIPAVFVRSIPTDRSGQPIFSQGSTVVDDSTPVAERWGGWYVTGTHGTTRHRGNLFSREAEGRLAVDLDHGGNRKDLPAVAGGSRYPAQTSDIVALMVFEHQCAMQNALTRAAFQCRRMLSYQQNLQRDLKETVTEGPTYDSARRVFDSCAQDVLDHLLLKDEAALPEGGIAGSPEFAEAYRRSAPSTKDGRSLKDLDLQQRLFRVRCSPLIYSRTFRDLPKHLGSRIGARLRAVLDDPAKEPRYAYLTAGERTAIRGILAETLPEVLQP